MTTKTTPGKLKIAELEQEIKDLQLQLLYKRKLNESQSRHIDRITEELSYAKTTSKHYFVFSVLVYAVLTLSIVLM